MTLALTLAHDSDVFLRAGVDQWHAALVCDTESYDDEEGGSVIYYTELQHK